MSSRLTDAEILTNYTTYPSAGAIDEGEAVDCARCGGHWTEPGVQSHPWNRIPNKATHLPRSVEVCDACYAELLELLGLVTD